MSESKLEFRARRVSTFIEYANPPASAANMMITIITMISAIPRSSPHRYGWRVFN
jgi:hypothetical protein